MPEPITRYLAKDGSEWDTISQAIDRESLVDAIADAMQPLGEKRHINHDEYVQHDPATVIAARVAILKLCAKEFPSFEVFKHEPPEEVHPMSIAGRILDDCGGPLLLAWGRFMRIDYKGREWEQPYFVGNPPNAAKQLS